MIKSFLKPFLTALAVVSLALVAQSAKASMIDYGDLANNATPGPGEGGYVEFVQVVDGITVTASAGDDYAYLDSFFNSMPAGLGVCQELDSSGDCTPSSDDNLSSNGYDEALTLTFTEGGSLVDVNITTIWIRNGIHDVVFDDNQFTLNGSYYDLTYEFTPPGASGTGSEFVFTAPDGDTDLGRMYIEKIEFARVPEPSTLLLLGSGLVGLGLVRRRFAV